MHGRDAMRAGWMPIQGGHYLAFHPGLLRDERWITMTGDQTRAWCILFLSLDTEPDRGWFKDEARAKWLLRREGDYTVSQAEDLLQQLIDAEWVVGSANPTVEAVTIRGWHVYADRTSQSTRPTDRAGRRANGEKHLQEGGAAQRAARVRSVHNETRLDETIAGTAAPTGGRVPVGDDPDPEATAKAKALLKEAVDSIQPRPRRRPEVTP